MYEVLSIEILWIKGHSFSTPYALNWCAHGSKIISYPVWASFRISPIPRFVNLDIHVNSVRVISAYRATFRQVHAFCIIRTLSSHTWCLRMSTCGTEISPVCVHHTWCSFRISPHWKTVYLKENKRCVVQCLHTDCNIFLSVLYKLIANLNFYKLCLSRWSMKFNLYTHQGTFCPFFH